MLMDASLEVRGAIPRRSLCVNAARRPRSMFRLAHWMRIGTGRAPETVGCFERAASTVSLVAATKSLQSPPPPSEQAYTRPPVGGRTAHRGGTRHASAANGRTGSRRPGHRARRARRNGHPLHGRRASRGRPRWVGRARVPGPAPGRRLAGQVHKWY